MVEDTKPPRYSTPIHHSHPDLALSIIGVFLLTILYESINTLRSKLDHSLQHKNHTSISSSHFSITHQFARSILHGFHCFYGLFIMMIFMTYNGFLCTALIFGHVFGFFVFSRQRKVDGSDVEKVTCCH